MNPYFCTYCRFYGDEYVGTRDAVVAHAASHPVGDPRDMARAADD